MCKLLYLPQDKSNRDSNKKSAFTLLELAISIAVIALLSIIVVEVGIIIAKARGNVIIQEQLKIRQSIVAFYQAYEGYPGDAVVSFSENEGNKNDIIESSYTPETSTHTKEIVVNSLTTTYEIKKTEALTMWEHLSKSEIYGKEESFSGGFSTIPNELMPDLPRTTILKNNKARYNLKFDSQRPEIINNPNILKKYHTLELSSFKDISGDFLTGNLAIVDLSIMQYIDKKIDNGMPLKGLVLGLNGTNDDEMLKCNTTLSPNSSATSVVEDKTSADYYINAKYNQKFEKKGKCILIIFLPELKTE